MENREIACRLQQMAVNTGTLNCLGCGYEQNCTIHGCRILKEAAQRLLKQAGKTGGQAFSASESVEQQCLFRWAEYVKGAYPELKLLYHIPNGGRRNKGEAGRLKAEGVKAGAPDVCLPVARNGFHGAYIELKKQGGRVSPGQIRWLRDLEGQGYFTAVCYSWEAAAALLKDYLDGKTE